MTKTPAQLALLWLRRSLAVLLLVLICRPPVALAEALPEAPTPADSPQSITISILEGEGALNNIRQRTAREPIVQVQDENHKPVAGAIILFSVHGGSGSAGATFGNGLTTLSVTTNAQGQAVATGFHPTGSGNFTITVTATVGALVVSSIIHMSNGAGGSSNTNNSSNSGNAGNAGSGAATHAHGHWLTWTLVGAAAAGAVLAFTIPKNNSTIITPGAGAVHQ